MNEGGYKNRKRMGEVRRKKRSRLSQFREAGLAVNTNVVIGFARSLCNVTVRKEFIGVI